MIQSVQNVPPTPTSPQDLSSSFKGTATPRNDTATITKKEVAATKENEDPTSFRLNKHIELSENPELYRKLVYPRMKSVLQQGVPEICESDQLQPYLDILKKIDDNPLVYESDNKTITNENCPVMFFFYFEGGSKVAKTFFDFYSNIKTKRCLNFIVSSRWRDSPETADIAKKHGYTIVGASKPKQDKTISMTLDQVKNEHGEDVLVSVNDLDHLLVWFDDKAKPRRYSTYTDIVRLYVTELLDTDPKYRACSNQNVWEKYVVPCTCLMERNEKYISKVEDGIVWSEYGVSNRFHPTANFFLDRRNETRAEKEDSNYAYSIGTVFANLRKYEVSFFVILSFGDSVSKCLGQILFLFASFDAFSSNFSFFGPSIWNSCDTTHRGIL